MSKFPRPKESLGQKKVKHTFWFIYVLSSKKERTLFKDFAESKFDITHLYDTKIIKLYGLALRIVFNDFELFSDKLLAKDY